MLLSDPSFQSYIALVTDNQLEMPKIRCLLHRSRHIPFQTEKAPEGFKLTQDDPVKRAIT